MKITLLPADQPFYKANLHCHSTLSDGAKSITELKDYYRAAGYSVLAYTDHDIFLRHYEELSDESFLALNGFEYEVNAPRTDDFSETRTCHVCMIAKRPDIKRHPLWHRTKYLFGNAPRSRELVEFDPTLPDFEREYTPASINEAMHRAREAGFFVTYNHPTWSLESYPEYSHYEGMDAMEIVNYSCQASGYPEYNARVYDDLLRQGKHLFCIAADDNHNHNPANPDSFGGFVMISAPALTYTDITDALAEGRFYASEGPEIRSLSYDTETHEVTITCSAARAVALTTDTRHTAVAHGTPEAPLTSATLSLCGKEKYFRLTVTDFDGRHADTNAYFPAELSDGSN